MSMGPHDLEADYRKRIEQVQDHIRAHPRERLSLDSLAAVAHFSVFHFHRIFRSFVGEPLGRYVQRTRLQLSAAALRAEPDRSILSVALDFGYESSEGFSRAFKSFYGLNPSSWDRNTPLQERKIGRALDDFPVYSDKELEKIADKHDFRVELATLPGRPVYYVRIDDAYQDFGAVMKAYEELIVWMGELGVDRDSIELLGLSWDDPDVTPVDKCTFEWACTATAPRRTPPGRIGVREIPSLEVARLYLDGSIEMEDIIWQYIYRVWLPRSPFKPDQAPAREVYTRLPDEDQWQRFSMWCALPIRRRRRE